MTRISKSQGPGSVPAQPSCAGPWTGAFVCTGRFCGAFHAFLIQTAQTALANGRSKNEERLARWLLMADDRIDGREVPLTHKFLGIMLGVQRPAVTVAVRALEREGLIRAGRQVITIIDRKGLERMSNGAYPRPTDLSWAFQCLAVRKTFDKLLI